MLPQATSFPREDSIESQEPAEPAGLEPPPPPYESVVMSSEVGPAGVLARCQPSPARQLTCALLQEPRHRDAAAGQPAPAPCPHFNIQVTDPLKQGEGVGVRSACQLLGPVHGSGAAGASRCPWGAGVHLIPGVHGHGRRGIPHQEAGGHQALPRLLLAARAPRGAAQRQAAGRWRWQATCGQAVDALRWAGIIVPPIPEKNAIQKYQMAQEFVAVRRQALQVFVNRVVSACASASTWLVCRRGPCPAAAGGGAPSAALRAGGPPGAVQQPIPAPVPGGE